MRLSDKSSELVSVFIEERKTFTFISFNFFLINFFHEFNKTTFTPASTPTAQLIIPGKMLSFAQRLPLPPPGFHKLKLIQFSYIHIFVTGRTRIFNHKTNGVQNPSVCSQHQPVMLLLKTRPRKKQFILRPRMDQSIWRRVINI